MGTPQEEEKVPLKIDTTTKEDYFLSVSSGSFEEGYDDDEVFLDDSQSLEMEASASIPSRIRRVSDVIDCVGETMSPSQIKRHSFPTTSSELRYSAVSKTSNVKAELAAVSIDLGYSSPGVQSSSFKETWFSYNTSSNADSIDARPAAITVQPQAATSVINDNVNNPQTINTNPVITMPVNKNCALYNMDHEYRGIAVIINNDTFVGSGQNLPDRDGSWKDVEELKQTFYDLNFEVLIWNNLYQEELIYRLKRLACHDHSKNDCFALVLLTHGLSSSFVYAKDNPYPIEYLWNMFTADMCPTLAGKPKMFFIQACRGEKLDSGILLTREETQVDSSNASYKIPKHADFLIAFSTYEGYYSFRHPENGTWFIQCLCSELNNHDSATVDILEIMTCVSRRVAVDHESHTPGYPWLHERKQIPTVHTTLIRKLFFKRKVNLPPFPLLVE